MPNTGPDNNKKRVHVAVGVIIDDEQRVLIALRPEGVHQGGLWEFPGGKVEEGESVEQALERELLEELGLSIEGRRQLVEIRHDYPDKSVLLDVWWIDQFSGTAEGREGQTIRWVDGEEIEDYEFPEANRPILACIKGTLLAFGE